MVSIRIPSLSHLFKTDCYSCGFRILLLQWSGCYPGSGIYLQEFEQVSEGGLDETFYID